MTVSSFNSALDVVDFLRGQHAEAKELFAAALAVTGPRRAEAFTKLRRLLAVHEAAEERVIHPRARAEAPGGAQMVQARLAEEEEAKRALAELEGLDSDTTEFTDKLRELQEKVIEHAQREEREEFSWLAREFDPDELMAMGRAARLAESRAPTRPRPDSRVADSALAGPFVAMLDRARDFISGKV
jgi:hypothetical protein